MRDRDGTGEGRISPRSHKDTKNLENLCVLVPFVVKQSVPRKSGPDPKRRLGRNTWDRVGSRMFDREMTHEIRDPTPDQSSGRDPNQRAAVE
jgi:hypothetical protein